MTTNAAELRAAADKLRDLATRTRTTLDRHEVEWTDLTVSDTAAKAKARPMVWSQYAAAMNPALGLALAEWLEHEAEIAKNAHLWTEREPCAWCGSPASQHALAVARALNPVV